jgi:hypothetical protein
VDHEVSAQLRDEARQQKTATKRINKLVSLLREETCGQVEVEKPNDVLRLPFENVNSLGVFSTGRVRGQRLKQMRYLLKKWVLKWHPLLKPKLTGGTPVRDSSLTIYLLAGRTDAAWPHTTPQWERPTVQETRSGEGHDDVWESSL